ncbi:MAG TPA: acylphosphatase [Bacteroidia bacterium]|nr:acylphosphatase [Bacteroidia bacterium]
MNITVYGKVQGVFFRATALEQARQFGITGFVRNEAGGAVYLEAEGEDEHLAHFLEWCGKGPEKAGVDRLEIVEAGLTPFKDFEIRR